MDLSSNFENNLDYSLLALVLSRISKVCKGTCHKYIGMEWNEIPMEMNIKYQNIKYYLLCIEYYLSKYQIYLIEQICKTIIIYRMVHLIADMQLYNCNTDVFE